MFSLFPSRSVPYPPLTIVGVVEKLGQNISTS